MFAQLRASIEAEHGVTCRFVPGDLSSAGGVCEMLDAAGGVDVLVNNAGIQHGERALAPSLRWP